MKHEHTTSAFVRKTRRDGGFVLGTTLVAVAVAFALVAMGIALATHVPANLPSDGRHATGRQAAPTVMHVANLPVNNAAPDLQDGVGQTGGAGSTGESGSPASPDGGSVFDPLAGDQADGGFPSSPDPGASANAESAPTPAEDRADASALPEGNPQAGGEDAMATLEETIQTATGWHYTVRVEYGADAEVPEGANLSVSHVLQVPEGYDERKEEFKGRPSDVERFVTVEQLKERQEKLEGAIGIRDDDYVFYTEFLDVAIESGNKAVKPAVPVRVTIETDAVSAAESDELRMSFFDDVKPGAEHAEALAAENRSGDGEAGKKYEEGVKISFEADELSELGLLGVAAPLASWQAAGFELTAYGPDSARVWKDAAYAEALPEGAELVEAFSLGVNPDPGYGTQLFLGVKAPGGESGQGNATSIACYAVENGVAGVPLLEGAPEGLAAVKAGGAVAVATVDAAFEEGRRGAQAQAEGAGDGADEPAGDGGWEDAKRADAGTDLLTSPVVYLMAKDRSAMSNSAMASAIRRNRLMQLVPEGVSAQEVIPDGKHTITWVNDDGTVLESAEVDDGTLPAYPDSGPAPTKESTAQYTYTFAGWTPEVVVATADATYTATYNETVNKYTVTWKVDGKLVQTGQVDYGTVPEYSGPAPTKAEDEAGIYTFSHWDPIPAAVTQDVTYVAQFTTAALVLHVQDFRDPNPAIAGAAFTLANGDGVVVWKSGETSDSGVLWIPRVDREAEPAAGKGGGATFEKGSAYTLKQVKTGDGYFLPLGEWALAVDGSGQFSCTVKGGSSEDFSTLEPETSGTHVYLKNRPAASIAYTYNYPEGSATGSRHEDFTEKLGFLSYRGEYVVRVADPTASDASAGQYEFAGWQVDASSTMVKNSQKTWLDTLSVQEHTMTAQWRKPLNVRAVTYANGDTGTVTKVDGSAGPFVLSEEKSKSFNGMTGFCAAYGEQNAAVGSLNGDNEYGFAFAEVVNGDKKKVVTSIQYDANAHAWQYRVSEGSAWANVEFGDAVTLYYTSEQVSLRWVQEQDDGSFRDLDADHFPDATAVVSSAWKSTDQLVAASRKPIVAGTSYYRSIGFGPSGATSSAALSKSGLQSFELRNTPDGFRFRTNAGEGDLLPGSDTVYVVYSETPPDDSVRLDVGNYTGYPYDLGNLFVGATTGSNYDWIASGKAIIAGDGDLRVMDDSSKVISPSREAHLVLVGAGAKSFVINGGFAGSVSDGALVSMAIEGSDKVTRTTVVKDAAHPSALSSTKEVTRGTLEAAPATVSVTFDTILRDLTVKKEWDEGSFPSRYAADLKLLEGAEGGKPCVITGHSPAATYTVTEDNGWSVAIANLPERCTYSVVEEKIRNRDGNKDITEDFEASYSLGADSITVSNVRSNDVCRVDHVTFKSVKAAVEYIGEHGKRGTIEMIADYTMPASAAVVVPPDYDITLKSAPGASAYTITRGFADATDMLLVQGKLTLGDITLSGRFSNGAIMTKDGNGGLVTVGDASSAGATLTVGSGARLEYGRATNGSAIYAVNGAVVNLSDCTITNNRATNGGAVGVADARCRINLSGTTFVYDNRNGNGGGERNIYLDQDSDEVIRITGAGLSNSASTKIGVYVPDGDGKALWNKHGMSAKPFATVDAAIPPANLDKLLSDERLSGESQKGHASDLLSNKVVWGPTFSFTADVQWLDQYFDAIDVPDGAKVTLKLNGGTQVPADGVAAEATLAQGDAAGWKFEFKGLASYDASGNPYEYRVSEAIVNPGAFKQVVFANDVGVQVNGVYDNPLTFQNKGDGPVALTISNYYRYTEFRLEKELGGNTGSGTTSHFALYRVPKTDANLDNGSIRYAGVGGVHDLPQALRNEGADARDGRFYTDGGNRWYVTVNGQPILFHRFYDSCFEEFTANGGSYALVSGDWQKGDVVSPEGGTCRVYTGTGWHDLGVSAQAARLKDFTRQDGDRGVEGAGGEAAGEAITITGAAGQIMQNLSSDYYYYAVETSVSEPGKSAAKDSHEIVALYNPQYSYDMLSQSETVKNTRQDFLSVEKVWSEDAVNMGKCHFVVYKLNDPAHVKTPAYLANAANFKALAEKLPASLGDDSNLTFVEEFNLPVEDGDAKGSWVRTVQGAPTAGNGVYFVWETMANSVQIVAPGVDESSVTADVVYGYDEDVNQITVHNMSDILCKVVDDNGDEHPFRKLNDALAYGRGRDASAGSNSEFTIYMLRDYSIPASDIMQIGANEKITLTTASTKDGVHRYTNNDDGSATRAAITRKLGNTMPFVIVSGVSGNSDLTGFTLENIAFDGAGTAPNGRIGNVTYDKGSFIYANNASVVLRKGGSPEAGVKMENAKAANGGAIYAAMSHVTVSDAEFANCASTDTNGSSDRGGGAIWSSGNTRVSVTGSTFGNCTSNRDGGAVFANNTGTIMVSGSQFENCTSKHFGGAVSARNASGEETTVTSSVFSGCEARNGNSDAYGGGVYCAGPKLTVGGDSESDACTFTGCVGGVRGGGVCHDNTGGATVVRHCTFKDCQMTATIGANNNPNGGAGVSTNADALTLADCAFTDCSSYLRGGGAIHFNLSAKSSTVEDCSFANCTAGNSGGGGLENASPLQSTRHCSFTDCAAPKSAGGGLDIGYFNVDKVAVVEDCAFTRCLAGGGDGGGGICAGGETLTATGCTFDSCKAVAPEGSNSTVNGGGVSMSPGGSMREVALYGCSFVDCTAGVERGNGQGGAVYSKGVVLRLGDDPATGAHTAFADCRSRGAGGAICQSDRNVDGVSLTAERVSFADCSSVNGHGGAIRTFASTARFAGCTFGNCASRESGGALSQDSYENYIAGSTLAIDDCTFASCRSGVGTPTNNSNGGAVFTDVESVVLTGVAGKATFDDCSSYGSGGAIYHGRSDRATASATITAASFAKCRSTAGNGGGVYASAPVVRMTRVSFEDGSCMWTGGAVHHAVNNNYVGASEASITACTFKNLEAGVNSSNNNAHGGAVYTSAKTLTAKGEKGILTFGNCKAKGLGGAIYHDRNYETAITGVGDCSFADCASTRSSGGAIHATVPVLTLESSSFARCRSYWSGGAVSHSPSDTYLPASRTDVSRSTFEDVQAGYGNTESNMGAHGGAVYANAMVLTLVGESGVTTFKNAVARGSGGAVYQGRGWEDTAATFSYVSFEGVTAQNYNGGAICAYATTLDASDIEIAHASSKNSGGAIHHEVNGSNETRLARGATRASRIVVTDSISANESGGGLNTSARTLVIDGVGGASSFADCMAKKTGGAVRHANDKLSATTTISDCSFDSCASQTDAGGGGVWTQATKAILDTCRFTECTAYGGGGGLHHYIQNNSQVASCSTVVKGCSFAACASTNQWGGGVKADTLVVTVSSTPFDGCSARYGGGGVYQSRNSEGSSLAVAGSTFSNCQATFADNDSHGGGAINAVARTLDVRQCAFTGCSAKNRGGTLYHANAGAAATAKLTGCVISGSSVSERNGFGGAVFFLRSDAALANTAIKDCTASAVGGAIYQANTDSRPLMLEDCTISGNRATTYGAGVYFDSNNTLTLRNGTSVTGNVVGGSAVGNGAGIYIEQQRLGRLVLGENGRDTDTITVYDNKTSAGAQSNVRLVQGSYDSKAKRYLNRSSSDLYSNSVVLLSNLGKEGYGIAGTIGVCNPGPEKTRFGQADMADRTGVEYIVSDIDSMRGKVDPVDIDHKMLIWYAPPVCKITDVNGTTLAYGGSNSAVFTTLEEAFEVVNVLTRGYLKNGDGVTPSQIQIQMLVPEYKTRAPLPVLRRSITITTSDVGDDEFHYPRNAVTKTAMVKRGDDVDGSLVTVGGNVTLTVARVTIDGGTPPESPREVPADGGLIYGQGGSAIVLSSGSVLQNSAVGGSNSGGAVFVTGASDSRKRSLVMEKGAIIRDCSAGNGGGVFLTGGVFFDMRDASGIESCSASQAGGAVYVSPYATMAFDNDSALPNPIPVIVGNRITNPDGEGAGIYLASNESELRLQLGARARIADNIVLGTEDAARQNGYDDYPLLRQDIFLVESREPATSITLIGDMSQPAGSLWVWAKYENHYKSEMQFAVIDSDANGNPAFTPREQTLEVFRNAQDDVATENTSGSYVYGIRGDGVDIIWSYEEGANHVILKKVGDTGSGYESLEGAVFTVYKGRSTRPYIVRHDDGTRETLSGLVSGANGVFWIGKLPYGTYYLEETTVPGGYSESARWFKLNISEDGVSMSRGYANRADAG